MLYFPVYFHHDLTVDFGHKTNTKCVYLHNTCDPLGNGVEEETLEVIIEQLIRSRKDLTVCSVHCLSKAVGKVLD